MSSSDGHWRHFVNGVPVSAPNPKKTIQAFGIHDVATRLTCGGCRKHISSPDGKCYRCVPKSLRDK
jgi:uncharacterized protein (DUF2126 family)